MEQKPAKSKKLTTAETLERFKRQRDRILAAPQAPKEYLDYLRKKFHDNHYDIRRIVKGPDKVSVWNLIYWLPAQEVYKKHPEFGVFGQYPLILSYGFWRQYEVEADELNMKFLECLQYLPSIAERERMEDAAEEELEQQNDKLFEETSYRYQEAKAKGFIGHHVRDIRRRVPNAVKKNGYVVIDHRRVRDVN